MGTFQGLPRGSNYLHARSSLGLGSACKSKQKKSKKTNAYFLPIQKRVLSESQEHNDLVVEDFHDVYLNLTMKTGFLLKWLNQDCPRAKFVLKVCNLISVLLFLMNLVGH